MNPWSALPNAPPFVLPGEEQAAVEEFNRTAAPKYRLHTDALLPEAFVGAKDAPVVLLSNNPGLSATASRTEARQSPVFREWVRKSLLHEPLEYPFFYLAPVFRKIGGGDWWDRKLKRPLATFERVTVARSFLNVVYFPYPSLRFGHRRIRVPSQEYSFALVSAAVERGAVIVLMRPGKRDVWLEAVPKLANYSRFHAVKNPQNPTISPKNCDGYSEVVKAIETSAGAMRVHGG